MASQTGEEPRVPPLRAVIADRDAQRLLLPDQHEQPLPPRDPRVDQVALEQHVVLRGERDHNRRELRSLRLVDTGSTKWQAERLRKVSVEMHKKSSDMPQEYATLHPAQIGYAKRSLEREVPSRTFWHPREFLLRGSRNINLAGSHQFRVRDLG